MQHYVNWTGGDPGCAPALCGTLRMHYADEQKHVGLILFLPPLPSPLAGLRMRYANVTRFPSVCFSTCSASAP